MKRFKANNTSCCRGTSSLSDSDWNALLHFSLRRGRLQQLSEPTIQHSHLHVTQKWRCESGINLVMLQQSAALLGLFLKPCCYCRWKHNTSWLCCFKIKAFKWINNRGILLWRQSCLRGDWSKMLQGGGRVHRRSLTAAESSAETTLRWKDRLDLDIYSTQLWSIMSLSLPLINYNYIWVYRIQSVLPAAFGNLIFKSLAHGAFTQIASALFLCRILSR